MQKKVVVCIKSRSGHQPSCGSRGGEAIATALEGLIAQAQLDLKVERFKCLGFCEDGPNLKLSPEGRFIHDLALENLEAHLVELSIFSKADQAG